jgi:hypothetical protein
MVINFYFALASELKCEQLKKYKNHYPSIEFLVHEVAFDVSCYKKSAPFCKLSKYVDTIVDFYRRAGVA